MDTDRLSTQSWSDRDFVLRVVKKSGHSLQFASKELRADKAVVLEALRQNGHALTYASKELRSNKQVVLEAVRQEGFALFHASKHLQADKEVVLEVVKQNGEALPIATVGLRTDKDVVLEAIRHDGQFLEYANKEHRHCRDIVLEAVRQRGAALRLASVELQADREIVFEAVKQDLLGFAARCARSRTFGNHPATEAMFAYWGVQFARASPLAVRGEEAPTVSFKLLQRPRQQQPQDQEEETRRRQQQQQQQQPSEDSRTTASATSFQCEAFLLSGATFKFCIPDHKSSKPKENQRHYPILNDLAEKLLEELQKDHKAEERIFINFIQTEDGESLPVTAWDWDRPLHDFLPQTGRGPEDEAPEKRRRT